MQNFLKSFLLSLFVFVFTFGLLFFKKGLNKSLFNNKSDNAVVSEQTDTNNDSASQTTIHIEYDLLGDNSEGTSKLLKHYEESSNDVVARMYIPNTGMETPLVDSDYYFRRNLAGEYDVKGVPFLENPTDFMIPNHNTIIYGHRLDDGEDFGMLRNYISQRYYEKHPIIYIETDSGETTWQIISVFTINIDEDAFDYSQYTDFTDNKVRNTFMSEIKQRNLLETENYTYQENAEIITLSTCHYETDPSNGRLAIVAVRQ